MCLLLRHIGKKLKGFFKLKEFTMKNYLKNFRMNIWRFLIENENIMKGLETKKAELTMENIQQK